MFGAPRNLRPRYNIAPTTNVDVIRVDREGRRELVSMRWGLVPYFWKKSLKEVPATFNARFGRGAVGFGTAGVRHSWGLRREFISPRYTTVWDELLRV